jgi:hypothetical protein
VAEAGPDAPEDTGQGNPDDGGSSADDGGGD